MKTSHHFPSIKELSALIRAIKPYIRDDYLDTDNDETIPGIDLTIGNNPETGDWSYQTGDNSFSGGAYGFPNWAVTRVYRRSDSRYLAKYLISQLRDLAYQ